MKYFFKYLNLGLIIFLFLTGCMNRGGTDTGNPSPESSNPCAIKATSTKQEMLPDETGAAEILNVLCSKLTECFPDLTESACNEGLLGTTNIDTELGITEETVSSYQEIITLEAEAILQADSTSLDQCLTDLTSFSCEAEVISNSFNPSNSSDFSHVVTLIDAAFESCSVVYENSLDDQVDDTTTGDRGGC